MKIVEILICVYIFEYVFTMKNENRRMFIEFMKLSFDECFVGKFLLLI